MKQRIFRLMVMVLYATVSQAQIDTLGSVSILGAVTYDPTISVYSYNYSMSNPATSTGSINRLGIDLARPLGTVFLDTTGLAWVDTITQSLVGANYSVHYGRVTSVSFSSRPSHWTGSISNELMGGWFTTWSFLLPPGQNLAGFGLQSKGLPTIRTARISPYLDIEQFPDPETMPTVEAADSIVNLIDSLRAVLPRHVKTVAPTNPPDPFTALTFLDTIKSYITESRTLGWITTQATADKYTALMNSAQAHLSSTPPLRGVAKAKLDSVLVNVYPDSGAGTITSEAYALLRFNTEYVLKKLREEDEQGKVIDGKEK
jgi:hypothetical protein